MTSALPRRRLVQVATVSLTALAVAHPAFAQSTGVGGDIGTFIQNLSLIHI